MNATPELMASHGPAALRGPGHSSPAEGLLPFLPSSGQDVLFERIQDLRLSCIKWSSCELKTQGGCPCGVIRAPADASG